nr:Rrf2 family transcriptional regulator [uncultured Lichenicoccus sp.]
MIDMRFPTALQMVLSLAVALETGQRCTSGGLAAGLGANPSLVRKLLVPLSRDRIVASSLGKNGGVRLGRPANQITLRDVYRSITEDKRIMAARPRRPALVLRQREHGPFLRDVGERGGGCSTRCAEPPHDCRWRRGDAEA